MKLPLVRRAQGRGTSRSSLSPVVFIGLVAAAVSGNAGTILPLSIATFQALISFPSDADLSNPRFITKVEPEIEGLSGWMGSGDTLFSNNQIGPIVNTIDLVLTGNSPQGTVIIPVDALAIHYKFTPVVSCFALCLEYGGSPGPIPVFITADAAVFCSAGGPSSHQVSQSVNSQVMSGATAEASLILSGLMSTCDLDGYQIQIFVSFGSPFYGAFPLGPTAEGLYGFSLGDQFELKLDSLDINASTPEPSIWLMTAVGLGGLALLRTRQSALARKRLAASTNIFRAFPG
jgi:MYXO-CTERM domain-containing protein